MRMIKTKEFKITNFKYFKERYTSLLLCKIHLKKLNYVIINTCSFPNHPDNIFLKGLYILFANTDEVDNIAESQLDITAAEIAPNPEK